MTDRPAAHRIIPLLLFIYHLFICSFIHLTIYWFIINEYVKQMTGPPPTVLAFDATTHTICSCLWLHTSTVALLWQIACDYRWAADFWDNDTVQSYIFMHSIQMMHFVNTKWQTGPGNALLDVIILYIFKHNYTCCLNMINIYCVWN